LKGRKLQDSILRESTKVDCYLSEVIKYAYKRKILITNPALSRNPFSSAMLYKAGSQLNAKRKRYTWEIVASKLFKYYIKSFFHLFYFFIDYISFRISKLEFDRNKIDKNRKLIAINTFTMIDKIFPREGFDDTYFGSLYDILKKRDQQYVIICFLFGDRPWNLRRRIATYNILSQDGRNFVTAFDLMGFQQWFDLVKYILICPIRELKLTSMKFGSFDQLFREEVLANLDTVELRSYVRYLIGKELCSLTNKSLKLIVWYENQVADKLLFKAIREACVDSEIFGCQFFIKFPLWSSLYPLPAEAHNQTLPDEILVSGKYYLDGREGSNIRLGMSPRYNYLFDIELTVDSISQRSKNLVLLTYDILESKKIIKMVERFYTRRNPEFQISVKLHPNHLLLQPFSLPTSWDYTEDKLTTLCMSSSIVITSGGSSVAIESAVMGCSVIIIGNNDGLTLNPMPEYGEGKIWNLVFDEMELKHAIDRLGQYRNDNPREILSISRDFRDMFFTQATEEKYVTLFDL
jgi:hypothetical protein